MLSGLNRPETADQIEHILLRQFTILLPLQAGGLNGAMPIRHNNDNTVRKRYGQKHSCWRPNSRTVGEDFLKV